MTNNHTKSDTYEETERGDGYRNPVPIPAPGIGTRIAQVAGLLGVRKNAYEVAGISSATLQRYIAEETGATFDALARLCLAAGVHMEWLATGEEPMLESEAGRASQSVQPDAATLQNALELIDRALALLHRKTDTAGKARLVGVAYKIFAAHKSAADALQEIVQAIQSSTGE